MPIPESPQTREEQYLNAMATGDSSGIPDAPVTREEMYLDTIARNGGGGSPGGVLVVHITWNGDVATLDKTWQEILDAEGAVVFVEFTENENEPGYVIYYFADINVDISDKFYVMLVLIDDELEKMKFIAEQTTDYPSYESQN